MAAANSFDFRKQDVPAALIVRKIRRRHLAAGIVALILSVGLHVLLLELFPDIAWHIPVRGPRKETYPQIQLQSVRIEPAAPATRPARFRPENPAMKVNLPAEAAEAPQKIDQTILEPKIPEASGGLLAGENAPARELQGGEGKTTWDPRQEIVMIDKTIVDAPLPALPRRYVPATPRVRRATDLVFAQNREEALRGALSGAGSGAAGELDLEHLDLQHTPAGWGEGGAGGGTGRRPAVAPTMETARIVGATPSTVAPIKALEKYLTVQVARYEPLAGPYGYARIEIRRINDQLLPVLPKDILLVQDCSASMTDLRLRFCREGLARCLALLNPEDHFNIVAFRDQAAFCFPDWQAPTPEAIATARVFVERLVAQGNTDIYGSLSKLLACKRTPGRPLLALVLSDGIPTAGETDSSQIIGEFSRANHGTLSVFTVGTIYNANRFLLDLLSYCNRGDTFVETRSKWDIPADIEARMRMIARPVLTDVNHVFSAAGDVEVYPALTSNLYLDRSLVLYARYPKHLDTLVFRVTGKAGDVACDMIFTPRMDQAQPGDESIRTQWAWQKIYDLIGEHTRTRSPEALRELQRVGRAYGLKVPYQAQLNDLRR